MFVFTFLKLKTLQGQSNNLIIYICLIILQIWGWATGDDYTLTCTQEQITKGGLNQVSSLQI